MRGHGRTGLDAANRIPSLGDLGKIRLGGVSARREMGLLQDRRREG